MEFLQMTWLERILLMATSIGFAATALGQAPQARKLTPVPFTNVTLTDSFWAPRIELARTATAPHCLDECEKTGRIRNFEIAGGLAKGKFEGIYFNDSDLYKVIEGVAYCLALHSDPPLEARVDKIIDAIAIKIKTWTA